MFPSYKNVEGLEKLSQCFVPMDGFLIVQYLLLHDTVPISRPRDYPGTEDLF